MNQAKYNSVLIIGVGLIGSSLARAIKDFNISKNIYGVEINSENIEKIKKLDILTDVKNSIDSFSIQFDFILICTPLSTYKKIFKSINDFVTKETLITDVGSTKTSVIDDFKKMLLIKN